jgi:putative endonuclease
MHYLYILQSQKDGRYYIGITNDVQRRLEEHNSGLSISTAPYKPWIIKRVEEYNDIKLAYKRERFIKAKRSRKIIEKIISS